MSEDSNERAKVAMRDQNSTNLNTSGKDGVKVQSPKQVKYVTKTTTRGHPYADKK